MASPRPRIFYGWVIVLTAAIGLLLGYAPIFVYSFSVFIKSLAQDFHSSRTSISFAFTLANLMQSVGAPLVGRLVDRFGANKVIIPSTVLFALVLISFKYSSTSLWHLYAFFIVIGLIGVGTAPVPYGIVVSRWFDKDAAWRSAHDARSFRWRDPPASIAQRLIVNFGWRKPTQSSGASSWQSPYQLLELSSKIPQRKWACTPTAFWISKRDRKSGKTNKV